MPTIVVLDQGKIIEQGDHQKLYNLKGFIMIFLTNNKMKKSINLFCLFFKNFEVSTKLI